MFKYVSRLVLCLLVVLGSAPVPTAQAVVTQDRWNVQQWGAVADGTTDVTTKIQAAINAVAGYGGGTLIFPTGTYRTTAALTMGNKVSMVGQDSAKIYLDYNATSGYGLVGSGTLGTPNLLTANTVIGDKTISAVNTYAAGDIVGVESTHNGSKWPVEVMTVASSTGTTVTFTAPLRVAYLMADGAKVTKYTTKSWTLDGLIIEQASGRDIQEIIYSQYTRNVTIRNCKVLKHRAPTNVASKIGIHIFDSITANVTGNWLQSINEASPGGDGISVADCSSMLVSNNHIDGYSFGIGVNNSAGCAVTTNTVIGDGVGGRGIKVKGCQGATVTGNAVSNSGYSAFKIEDSGRCSITGNTANNCGVGSSGDSTINVSSVTATADAVGRHVVSGNTVSNIKGEGIAVSFTDPGCIITGNLVQNIQFRAIDSLITSYTRIANNTVIDWGYGYTGTATPYQGIVFHETNQVVNNMCYRTDGMGSPPPAFASAFTSIAANDGTVFVGNISMTTGTGFSSTTNHDVIGQNYGNSIVGYGQKILRGTAAPVAGTFEVGDRVINFSTSAGAPSGWVCITAGTPGTWKELAPISL